MNKVTIKVADLTGAALDWAVAVAEGKDYSTCKDWGNATVNDLGRCSIAHRNWNGAKYFEPSKNWGHGGPIIQRERITIEFCRDLRDQNGLYIHAEMGTHQWHGYWRGDHDHPLTAAMRCYVASKLGESIDVPQHVVDATKQGGAA